MQQTTKKSDTIENNIVYNFLAKIIIACTGYFSDALYQFHFDAQSILCLQPYPKRKKYFFSCRCLVLGREHYYETSKEYPIANKRELLKVISFETNDSPYSGIQLQHIERISEQSHRVTFWVVKAEVIKNLAVRPWLIFPESFLVAKGFQDAMNIASISRSREESQDLFVSSIGQGIVSALKSNYIPNLQTFAYSTGVPLAASDAPNSIDKKEFPLTLQRGFLALSISHWGGFIYKTKQLSHAEYPWKMAGITSALMLFLYLSLSSIWLVYQEGQIESQLFAQKQQVNQALAQQQKFKQQLEWQEQLSKPLQGSAPYWYIWGVVIEMVSEGATLQTIDFKNTEIRLNGTTIETKKATDILAKLAENPLVESPKFVSPVRAHRGKERFTISFKLAAKKVTAAEEADSHEK